MADPRGCEYREIEVVVGDVWQASGIALKTHGWVLPAVKGALTNYAIGWNGLVYPLVSKGGPASAENDARAMVPQMTHNMALNNNFGNLRGQAFASEEYCMTPQWLTPSKAAMIFRFAPPALAEECALTMRKNDSFLLLAEDRLWTLFDRAICALIRDDDDLAFVSALNLAQARKTLEAEAKARGLPEQFLIPGASVAKPGSFFPFLEPLDGLLRDQERRHERKTPLRDPAKIADKGERIAALIDQLENIAGGQAGRSFLDYDLLRNPTVQALLSEGWDAVEPLLQCYEHDDRLTRMVPVSHFIGGGGTSRLVRKIIGVRAPAYAALEGILETTQFAPNFSRDETPEEKASIYKNTAAAMRAYWTKYRGLTREERLYAILKDEDGNWLEAASIIVQPTNQPIVPFIGWNSVPWASPLNLDDPMPMRGESLRSESNPSVSELMIRRVNEIAARGRGKISDGATDDARDLNTACDLSLCLAKWDTKAALPTIQKVTALAIAKLDPKHPSSLVSHMELSGQLPALIAFRARAGDKAALAEYARWLKSSDPGVCFLQIRQMLAPLREFPTDSAWRSVWKFLFDEKNSPWFKFLLTNSSPDPRGMSAPFFNLEEFFGTPIINNSLFRKFVVRLLNDKSPCGKIMGDSGGYWLTEQISISRQFGYTVSPPPDGENIDGTAFRTCDFYAWLLSNRISGAPVFQLYWPEEQRDRAILELTRMLSNNGPFKTQPFQEP